MKLMNVILGIILAGAVAFGQVPVKPVDGTGAELATQTRNYTVTIAANGTTSTSINLAGGSLLRIIMPTTAQGWDTANITLQYSENNSTWFDMTDSYGSAITITAAANKAIQVDLPGLIGLKYIKLVSTATQTAERVLTVVSKPI